MLCYTIGPWQRNLTLSRKCIRIVFCHDLRVYSERIKFIKSGQSIITVTKSIDCQKTQGYRLCKGIQTKEIVTLSLITSSVVSCGAPNVTCHSCHTCHTCHACHSCHMCQCVIHINDRHTGRRISCAENYSGISNNHISIQTLSDSP